MSSPGEYKKWMIPAPIWSWLRWPLWVLAWGICIYFAYERLYHARHEFDTNKWSPQHQRGDHNSGHTEIDFGGQWVSGRMVYEGYGRQLYHRNRLREVVRRGYPVTAEHPTSQESILPPEKRVHGAPDEKAKHDADALMGWLTGQDPPEWMDVGKAAAVPLMTGSHGNPFAAAVLQQISQEQVTRSTLEKVDSQVKPTRGGGLYPPIHALFYAPLASLPAQRAYYTFQRISLAAAFISGLAIYFMSGGSWPRFATPSDRRQLYRRLPGLFRRDLTIAAVLRSGCWHWLPVMTPGRIWWPVATTSILLYPGTQPGLDLGQNHLISMMIVLVGWALFVRGYEVGAGIVWGFLAYKPVWAIAFILVPMLMGRLRFFLAMSATGLGLIVLTLPFVGVQTWKDWLYVGHNASGGYSRDQNWLRLSRDLAGLVRRLIVDVETGPLPQSALADVLGWLVPGLVVICTVFVYLLRADREKTTGVTAGFLLLAGYLGCLRFMYYDVALSFVAFAAIFATPIMALRTGRFIIISDADAALPQLAKRKRVGYINSLPLLIFASMLVLELYFQSAKVRWLVEIESYTRDVVNATGGISRYTPGVTATTNYYYPTDTYLLFALWVWCGWRVWRDGEHA